MTEMIYWEVKPGQQGTIDVYLHEKMLNRHERYRSDTLLFGQQVTNTANMVEFVSEVGHDVAVRSTEGFVTFAKTAAVQDTYTTGSYAQSDLQSIAVSMQDQQVSTSNLICAWVGQTYYLEVENAFSTVVLSGGGAETLLTQAMALANSEGTFDKMSAEARQNILNYGFAGIKTGGFSFLFKQLDDLNNITGAGGSAFGYKTVGIFHPDMELVDSETASASRIVGYHWKAHKGYNRDVIVGSLPGFGTHTAPGIPRTPVDQWDRAKTGLLSNIAGHFGTSNRIVYHKPA